MRNLSSWLSFFRRAARPGRRPSMFRPGVEGLEGREVPATFTVTTNADAGAGSLRDAINKANAHVNTGGVADKIKFNISGSTQIVLKSALDAITEAVVIDGTTQPGSGGQPAVELVGNSTSGPGLVLLNHTGSTVNGLVINRFTGDGLDIIGGGGHTVSNNFIGTSTNGGADLGNGGDGVHIAQSRDNTLVFNVISGNSDDGVEIRGAGATGNKLSANRVGLNSLGTAALGNSSDGVLITAGASSNRILNNVISGNDVNGVELNQGATKNTVRGNKIGTDVTGTIDLGNGSNSDDGVHIEGANGNVIGGLLAGQGNVISGNGDDGVEVTDSKDTRIDGNLIGTTASGLSGLGNDFGVFLSGAKNTLVRDNVISASENEGVLIDDGAKGNVIQGNLIGLGIDGLTALGNGSGGVEIFDASNNIIGGPAAGQRNVISSNAEDGVLIEGPEATGNVVQGNFIGTDKTGTISRGNAQDGVKIGEGANANRVLNNVISGNGQNGVLITDDGTTDNVVRGNLIGTDKTGMKDLGNALDGVHVQAGADGNVIGGPLAAHRNVISGNGDDGVQIDASRDNKVQGNLIGTDKTGLAKLGNNFGVFLTDAVDNVFRGNVISGNVFKGMLFAGSGFGSFSNEVIDNLIGVGLDGKTAVGNGTDGVFIDLGGGNLLDGNVIAHNGASGVAITGTNSVNNTLTENRIFANAGLGIDLNNDGVTANDGLDGDGGANRLLNTPVLNSAVIGGSSTTIRGTISSSPNTPIRIEFFSNANGGNEGQKFLGSLTVTTDANGNAAFKFVLTKALAAGTAVTTTATSLFSGDTSEFSAPRSAS